MLEIKQYQYRRPGNIIIENSFSDEWLNDFISYSGLDNQVFQRTAKNIVNNILGKVIVVRKIVDNKTVGCGYGAVEKGYVGIFDIIVDKTHRGNGYGQDIMDGILSTAAHENIENAYLSVVVGNVPAENLYQKIGFKEIYRYWYRKKE